MSEGRWTVGSELIPLEPIEVGHDHFQELPLSELQSVILPVVVMQAHTVTCLGTAFNIASSGLLLTAKHVVEEALDICASEPGSWISVLWMKSGVGYDDVPDLVGGQIPVRLIQINDFHDIALLQLAELLENGKPVEFPVLGIDTRVPPVGTPVLGVGYTKMDIREHENSPEERRVKATQACHASHGEVLMVYPTGRDSVMLPFPSFETSARFDPGMSGGPVFAGDSAKVCGVVCSGISEANESGGYSSFASMTVNALVLQVLTDPQRNESTLLFDLVKFGFVIADDNFEKITIVDDGSGAPVLQFPGSG